MSLAILTAPRSRSSTAASATDWPSRSTRSAIASRRAAFRRPVAAPWPHPAWPSPTRRPRCSPTCTTGPAGSGRASIEPACPSGGTGTSGTPRRTATAGTPASTRSTSPTGASPTATSATATTRRGAMAWPTTGSRSGTWWRLDARRRGGAVAVRARPRPGRRGHLLGADPSTTRCAGCWPIRASCGPPGSATTLWVRILDVPGALAARGYRAEDRLVLDMRWTRPRRRRAAGCSRPARGGASCRAARRADKTDLVARTGRARGGLPGRGCPLGAGRAPAGSTSGAGRRAGPGRRRLRQPGRALLQHRASEPAD